MSFEILVAISVAVVALLGWIGVLSSFGRAEFATSAGFFFRSIFKRRKFIKWCDLRGPGQKFDSVIPRIVLRRASGSLFRIHRSYCVLINGTPPETLSAIEAQYGVQVARLETFFKGP
jgi:hypothetical protein